MLFRSAGSNLVEASMAGRGGVAYSCGVGGDGESLWEGEAPAEPPFELAMRLIL
jgi:hypothetical protein